MTTQPQGSIDDVVDRMRAIEAQLPAADGVACFNRMYLEVTLAVREQVNGGDYQDPAFVARLDVVFAQLYFAAVDAMSGPLEESPAAWRPLLAARSDQRIEPIQFALAGMNAHINHDLPLAVVQTCTELGTEPTADGHHGDYQQVDALLDKAERAIRQNFESSAEKQVDRHATAVLDLVGNWSINTARDVAWDTALALWEVRGQSLATDLLTAALARLVATASQALLVAV